jgi:hypothetical protein
MTCAEHAQCLHSGTLALEGLASFERRGTRLSLQPLWKLWRWSLWRQTCTMPAKPGGTLCSDSAACTWYDPTTLLAGRYTSCISHTLLQGSQAPQLSLDTDLCVCVYPLSSLAPSSVLAGCRGRADRLAHHSTGAPDAAQRPSSGCQLRAVGAPSAGRQPGATAAGQAGGLVQHQCVLSGHEAAGKRWAQKGSRAMPVRSCRRALFMTALLQ